MASGEPRFVGLPYDPDDETTQYDPDVVTTQYSAEPKMDDASAVERQLQPPPKQTSTVQMRNKKNTAFDTSFDMLFKTPDVRAFFSERIISHLAWATFIVCLITLLLLLVVLVAPGWGWTREIRGRVEFEGEMYGKYGLWYACWELADGSARHVDCQLISELVGIPGWFHGCQAMAVLATVASIVALCNSSAYICAKSMNGNPMLIASVVVFSAISAVFSIILFIVFCVQFLLEAYWCCKAGLMEIVEWHLYYCFIIGCCVPAFNIASGIIAAMEVSRLRAVVRKERYAAERAESRESAGYNYEHFQLPGNFQPGYYPPQMNYRMY